MPFISNWNWLRGWANRCSCMSVMRMRISSPSCANTVPRWWAASPIVSPARRDQLHRYLALDLAIGITGWICDERRGAHLLPLLREIPAAALQLETDAPYLLPRDLAPRPASRRNEPQYLRHIAAVVAQARGETLEQLAATATAASRELFGLPPAPQPLTGRACAIRLGLNGIAQVLPGLIEGVRSHPACRPRSAGSPAPASPASRSTWAGPWESARGA